MLTPRKVFLVQPVDSRLSVTLKRSWGGQVLMVEATNVAVIHQSGDKLLVGHTTYQHATIRDALGNEVAPGDKAVISPSAGLQVSEEVGTTVVQVVLLTW